MEFLSANCICTVKQFCIDQEAAGHNPVSGMKRLQQMNESRSLKYMRLQDELLLRQRLS